MDDQTLDTVKGVTEGTIVSEDGNHITEVNQELNSAEERSSPLCQNIDELSNQLESLKIGGNTVSTVSMDESDVTEETEGECSDEEQTLPVLQKFEELSSKVQSLKKEHALLCSEVKDITTSSFPSEVVSALQGLSTEHEHLKKKYSEECELLKNKYIEECSERKRLYNEVIELKGNIRVFCRCRPLNQDEISNASSSIVDFETGHENELQIISSDSSKKQFKFDHVFKPDDNQDAVFVETSPIVTSVLDGYNVCIFAYGQTGTGKTFTMEGTTENRGVNYRTLEELFRISDERRSVMKYELSVSMLEVYNEKIRDLLIENSNQPSKKLDIKQAADGTQEVPGLIEASVHSTDEVWEILKSGSRARSVGSTNANELSSRSHCLLRVTVKAESLINGQKTKSHLWLVDLAGSERVGRIEVEGERLKESQFINRSLSALGDVISALASKSAHIPYRNSKLTHMLQSSLGGDCKTVMFVQISPSATDLGETLCSLNFASRVRGIEHGPARKHTDTTELLKYKQLAEKAKNDEKEMKRLQDTLQSLQLRLAAREQISRSLQEKVRDLENQLAEERKTRLKQETKALAAVSSQPPASASLNRAQKAVTAENKPPLGPSKLRMPLRRITNFMPSPSPLSSNLKTRPPPPTSAALSNSTEDKENLMRNTASAAKAKTLVRARRGSFAVRPTQAAAASQTNQPKRRASIATFRPEPSSNATATPLNSGVRPKNERVMGRQSFVWDPQRVWRTSRVSPPMPQVREEASASSSSSSYSRTVEATPVAPPKSRRFMGSPPTHAGSWKPKHPTVVALQRKQIVWSPLKLKSMKGGSRRSLQPY